MNTLRLAAVTVVCFAASLSAFAQTLSVTGSALVEVDPDQVEIAFAVVSEFEELDKAMKDNADRMNRVFEALTRAGVEKDDLETAGFSISPRYNYNRQRDGEAPQIIGYSVSNTVVATTPRLELAGDLIDTGVKAGANRVSGLVFGLQNPQEHRAKAIAEATANARSDAEALARAAGLTLQSVVEITLDPEYGASPRGPMMEMGARAVASDAAPPMSPGEVSLSARVRIIYAVGQ